MGRITWICRLWTQKHGEWTSEVDRFGTEEAANEFGQWHLENIHDDETEREYEVYRDFD